MVRLEVLASQASRFAARLRGRMRHLPFFLLVSFAATSAWIVLWSGYDLVILTGAFPSAPGYRPNLTVYWEATWWVLFPVSTFLVFRRHAWLPILALAVGGWEDIFFYWLEGRGVPATLSYLPQTPTAELLYLRAVLFLLAALAGAVVVRSPRLRIPFVPLEVIMLLTAVFGSFWLFVASIPAYASVKWVALREGRRAWPR